MERMTIKNTMMHLTQGLLPHHHYFTFHDTVNYVDNADSNAYRFKVLC